jgi:hypothetical protein
MRTKVKFPFLPSKQTENGPRKIAWLPFSVTFLFLPPLSLFYRLPSPPPSPLSSPLSPLLSFLPSPPTLLCSLPSPLFSTLSSPLSPLLSSLPSPLHSPLSCLLYPPLSAITCNLWRLEPLEATVSIIGRAIGPFNGKNKRKYSRENYIQFRKTPLKSAHTYENILPDKDCV